MKIFTSIAHFFAWAFGKIQTGATDLQEVVASPIVQAIEGLTGKLGSTIGADVNAIAGSVVAAAIASGAAIGDSGLNVALDETALAALKNVVAQVKAALAGQTVPVASATAGAGAVDTPVVPDSSTASVLN